MTRMSPPRPNDAPAGRPVRSDFARQGGLSYGARRFLTLALAVVILAAAVYALWGRSAHRPGNIPTIKAEGASYKQKPEDPGGVNIPNQDVQVYHEIDGATAPAKAVPAIEHMLPPPEEPNAKAIAPNAFTKTGATPAEQVEDLKPGGNMAASVDPILGGPPPPVATTVASSPVLSPASSVEADRPPSLPQPAAIPEPPPVLPTVAATPVMPSQAPARAKTVMAGTTAVQLAALPDENAAAATTKALQAKYKAILGDVRLHSVRADLGAKGVFYRIQSQPIPEADAKSICASVRKQSGGCLLVHP